MSGLKSRLVASRVGAQVVPRSVQPQEFIAIGDAVSGVLRQLQKTITQQVEASNNGPPSSSKAREA